MPPRKVVTLHPPISKAAAYEGLGRIERFLRESMGATNVWVTHDGLPDLIIMADIPSEEDQ